MGPLNGITIADFSRVLAGPYATMLLADLGAEVIKVERPGIGDDTRHWGPPYDAQGTATYFAGVNRNKTSRQIDLGSPAGLAEAKELIAHSDVVIENFRVGTMARLGLSYEHARALNPRVIYASLSGYGTSPAGARLGGYDLITQATGGLMSITGEAPGREVKVGVAVVDVLTGLHLGMGILAALIERERSGEGQLVETNLMSTLLSSLVNQASAFVGAGVEAAPMGNRHPSIAPYQVFPTGSGDIAIAAGNDALYEKLRGVLGLPADPRFATNASRVAHREELVAQVTEALAAKSAREWFEVLADAGVPAGPVNSIGEAFAFAAELGLDPIVEIDGQRSVRNPLTFSRTPVEYHRPAPRL